MATHLHGKMTQHLKKFTFEENIYRKPVIPDGNNSYGFSKSNNRNNY